MSNSPNAVNYILYVITECIVNCLISVICYFPGVTNLTSNDSARYFNVMWCKLSRKKVNSTRALVH